jgi:hypothetical protein
LELHSVRGVTAIHHPRKAEGEGYHELMVPCVPQLVTITVHLLSTLMPLMIKYLLVKMVKCFARTVLPGTSNMASPIWTV